MLSPPFREDNKCVEKKVFAEKTDCAAKFNIKGRRPQRRPWEATVLALGGCGGRLRVPRSHTGRALPKLWPPASSLSGAVCGPRRESVLPHDCPRSVFWLTRSSAASRSLRTAGTRSSRWMRGRGAPSGAVGRDAGHLLLRILCRRLQRSWGVGGEL